MRFVMLLTPGDFILGAFLAVVVLWVVFVVFLDVIKAARRWLHGKLGR